MNDMSRASRLTDEVDWHECSTDVHGLAGHDLPVDLETYLGREVEESFSRHCECVFDCVCNGEVFV